MKLAVVLMTVLFGVFRDQAGNTEQLEMVRVHYVRAVSDKELCKTMIEKLAAEPGNSILHAYLGAFNAVWASHAFNPITKLRSFNKGKRYIEEAVKEDPGSIEIRFIRLSVQKNCPSFLGYSGQVEEDTRFIHTNIGHVGSEQLKGMIAAVLKK